VNEKDKTALHKINNRYNQYILHFELSKHLPRKMCDRRMSSVDCLMIDIRWSKMTDKKAER